MEAEAKAHKEANEKAPKSPGVAKPSIRPKVPIKR
jgi:hypothetical protein